MYEKGRCKLCDEVIARKRMKRYEGWGPLLGERLELVFWPSLKLTIMTCSIITFGNDVIVRLSP